MSEEYGSDFITIANPLFQMVLYGTIVILSMVF